MTKSTFITHNLGFPRMGANIELKKAVEGFWKGELTVDALLQETQRLRLAHWKLQSELAVDLIPSNDFSLYDQVLDHSFAFGAVPKRFQAIITDETSGAWDLRTYFAMAHGLQDAAAGIDVAGLEMKKWFDTNYHYMVPEFHEEQEFKLAANGSKALSEFEEARDVLGLITKPVLIGPVSFLLLGKAATGSSQSFQPISLLSKLLPVYAELVGKLVKAGAETIQFDEPFLAAESGLAARLIPEAYAFLRQAASPNTFFLLATYFDSVRSDLFRVEQVLAETPIDAIHLDAVRAAKDVEDTGFLEAIRRKGIYLSLGLIDGRNIWKTNLSHASELAQKAISVLGKDKVLLAPSCSLLHVPFSLEAEKDGSIPKEILNWMSFAKEKLGELAQLQTVLFAQDEGGAVAILQDNYESFVKEIETSPLIHDAAVKARIDALEPEDLTARKTPFSERSRLQKAAIAGLPSYLPTTTIGSFPQTKEVRLKRSAHLKGNLSSEDYEAFLLQETRRCIEMQERIGLDVLVHGEFERTDMVEFFGQKLNGYVFSRNGWVQST